MANGFEIRGGGAREKQGRGEAYDISFTASDVCVCLGTCSAAAILDYWLNI